VNTSIQNPPKQAEKKIVEYAKRGGKSIAFSTGLYYKSRTNKRKGALKPPGRPGA
jgi:hypothetical protein